MYYLNETIAETIKLVDSLENGVTGETANFTKKLQANGSYSATPAITISEVDSVNLPGVYRVSFIPDAIGDWAIEITHPTYNLSGWILNYKVIKRQADMVFGVNIASNSTDIIFVSALILDGVISTSPASVSISIYDETGTLINTVSDSTADTNGYFYTTWASHTLSANKVYQVIVTLVDANSVSHVIPASLKLE